MNTMLRKLSLSMLVPLALGQSLGATDVTGDYNYTGNVSFVNGIAINLSGSIFGNDTTALGYSVKDGIFTASVGSIGTYKGVNANATFNGASNTTAQFYGVYGVARTDAATTASLTSGVSGGGLKNRFSVEVNGAGNVNMGSAVCASISVPATGSMNSAVAYNVEPLILNTGASIINYYGLWVRSNTISGAITSNNYGIRVDTLNGGVNKYGLYIQTDLAYLGGPLTIVGEVSGAGVSTTSAANKLVKTNGSGKIDTSFIDGSAVTALNATQLTSGTVAAARGGAGTVSGILKANGSGAVSQAVAGTDYLAPTGNGSGLTGLTKSQVGLSSVDNTSDAGKPVSTAQQTALDLKAVKTITVTAGTGLTGGGDLSADRTIALSSATLASLAKADGSLANDLGSITTDGTGTITAAKIRVPESGDLDMGSFTAGTAP